MSHTGTVLYLLDQDGMSGIKVVWIVIHRCFVIVAGEGDIHIDQMRPPSWMIPIIEIGRLKEFLGRPRPIGGMLAEGPHQGRLMGSSIFSRHDEGFFERRSFPPIAADRGIGIGLEQGNGDIGMGDAPVSGQMQGQESILVAVSRGGGIGPEEERDTPGSGPSGTSRVQGQASAFGIQTNGSWMGIQHGIEDLDGHLLSLVGNENGLMGRRRRRRSVRLWLWERRPVACQRRGSIPSFLFPLGLGGRKVFFHQHGRHSTVDRTGGRLGSGPHTHNARLFQSAARTSRDGSGSHMGGGTRAAALAAAGALLHGKGRDWVKVVMIVVIVVAGRRSHITRGKGS